MPRKKFRGKVVSAKMAKAVVVAVEVLKRHRLYGKVMKNTRRFKAQSEGKMEVGDEVIIEESRPYSRDITWKVVEKVSPKEK